MRRRNSGEPNPWLACAAVAVLIPLMFASTVLAASSPAAPHAVKAAPSPLVGMIGTTGILQLGAPSFEHLDARQKLLAYWLSQAAIAIDPIIYDELSPYGTEAKRLLDGIAAHRGAEPTRLRGRLLDYIQLFWINHGNYNSETALKFLPNFTPAELREATETARRAGAWAGSREAMSKMLTDLQRPLFDASYAPRGITKNPPAGQDILTASANNFYPGVALTDLANFHEAHPLNSQVTLENGKLVERVYRAGTPDGKIPPGLYARELGQAITFLQHAQEEAEPAQQRVLTDLIRYYQSGDPADWHQFGVDWVQNNPPVDFANGFIEVYRDARGEKGTSQSFVAITDAEVTHAMKTLAANAGYFEQHDPWDAAFKNPNPKPPVAKAVEAVIETGDFGVGTIGDNLPNEQDIHAKYGSKSFIFTGSIRALSDALGTRAAAEFSYTPEELERAEKYQTQASVMMTAMHEVIGHGSGQLGPKVQGHEPAEFLKQYYSTLEETRADLVALWSFFDPKLIELGLIPNEEVAKAAYDNEARSALFQLREVPKGDTIEEDHRRGTQLIVNYVRAKTGGFEPRERDGKVYMVVTDYQKARQGVGMLLAELMRIKAEGDFDAIQNLVNTYGVHFNLAWRDQVLQRVASLRLPSYWGGVNPDLKLHKGTVILTYPRDLVKQRLEYAAIAAQAK